VDDLMPIGEFSERSGLSQKRLRTYAAAGLLVPAAVDSDSGYRYYAPGQLRDANVIDALRRAGVPLSAIATLLADPSGFDFDDWRRHMEDDAAARQEALGEALRLMRSVEDEARTGEGGSMTSLLFAARSETGPVRRTNEDAVVVGDRLAVVADGMGGAPGGSLASSLAVAVVDAGFGGTAASELAAVTRSANAAIFDRAAGDSRLEGMGTTLCAAGLLDEGSLVIVNVGDSRAYLLRDGGLRQLTEDHTVTAEMVRRGELDEVEAAEHPHRHVLTRVLGGGPTVEVDAFTVDVEDGDVVMLCTDGLSLELSNEDIAELMSRGATPGELADLLVESALAAGGGDNVTVVAGRVTQLSLAR
jgi:protein phosphatase